jgi:hypothetical protein
MQRSKGTKRGSKEEQQGIPECAVCGKQFPRGIVDLNRHVNAATLQHLFAENESPSYPFGCTKCGLHFTKDEHLTCHHQFSSCGLRGIGSNGADAIPAEKGSQDLDDGAQKSTFGSPSATNEEFLLDVGDSNRTLECMVCGKIFPRGPVDLQRHATAVTLKHLVASKRSSAFPNGCSKCGLWFTTEEHLNSHELHSTCNVDMIWPENAHSTAGLRAVSRAEVERQKLIPQSPVPVKTASSQSTASIKTSDSSNKSTNKIEIPLAESVTLSPLNTRKRSIRPNAHKGDLVGSPSMSTNIATEVDEATSMNSPKDSIDSKKRLHAAIREDLSHARQKRAKIIVPEERQAFFAIVSLLVEPRSVPLGNKVTDENFEEYIPVEHIPLLNKLKR